jgi:hypothetical protein
MPFLVPILAFLVLPVLFVICTGIVAFYIAIAASVATTSTALWCEGGALRMCHSCDHSFAILGISIVSGGEIVLQIHLEVAVLLSTLAKEGM